MKINNYTLKQMIIQEIKLVMKEFKEPQTQMPANLSSEAANDLEILRKAVDLEGLISFVKSKRSSLSESPKENEIREAEKFSKEHKLSLMEYFIGTPDAMTLAGRLGYGRIVAALTVFITTYINPTTMANDDPGRFMPVFLGLGVGGVSLLALIVMSFLRQDDDDARRTKEMFKDLRDAGPPSDPYDDDDY